MDPKSVADLYNYLIPPQDQGLVILLLHRKIENEEIAAEFTYQDVQQVVKEVDSILGHGHQSRTERILTDLMRYFIDRPADRHNLFILSNHADRFVTFIRNKLEHPYRNFPLIESFKRYSEFNSADINSIADFRSWYEQGFHATSRQTIAGHLEALNDDCVAAIQKMNDILYAEAIKGIELARQFTLLFHGFGDKADQISEILQLGNSLETEIKKVVTYFYGRLDSMKHPQTDEEIQEIATARVEFTEAETIQRSVSSFFKQVDSRLGQIREKVLFSSTKLRELQDNFRHQSNYKINIKKLLQFVLEYSTHSTQGPVLPTNFPVKTLPAEHFRLLALSHDDFQGEIINPVYEFTADPDHRNSEQDKIEKELNRQQCIARWVKNSKQLLEEKRFINLTDLFYHVLDQENDTIIGLQVNFELLQYARDKDDFKIDIERQFTDKHSQKEILTWKVQILEQKTTSTS